MTAMPAGTGTVNDFDFLIGSWNIHNRRLKTRWVGCEEWEEFPASSRCEKRMSGVVNVEETAFFTRGFSGMAVRVFDIAHRRWSIYWLNSEEGVLFPPVIGGFAGDHGVFRGEDTDGGRPIKVVFHWTRLGPMAARWEQAFSLDGRIWETNWVMDLTRQEA